MCPKSISTESIITKSINNLNLHTATETQIQFIKSFAACIFAENSACVCIPSHADEDPCDRFHVKNEKLLQFRFWKKSRCVSISNTSASVDTLTNSHQQPNQFSSFPPHSIDKEQMVTREFQIQKAMPKQIQQQQLK